MNHTLKILVAFMMYCTHPSNVDGVKGDEQVNAVKKLLREMPSWPKLSFVEDEEVDRQDREDAKNIEESVNSLYQVDSQVVRKAIEELLKERAPSVFHKIDMGKKIFLTLRGIFKIPRTIGRDSPRYVPLLSKWLCDAYENTNDYNGKSYPASWPWTEGNDGEITFNLNRNRHVLAGGSDNLLDVFDYMEEHFERRKSGSGSGDSSGEKKSQ